MTLSLGPFTPRGDLIIATTGNPVAVSMGDVRYFENVVRLYGRTKIRGNEVDESDLAAMRVALLEETQRRVKAVMAAREEPYMDEVGRG